MILVPIKPRVIAQETLGTMRMLGEYDSLVMMGRGFGAIKHVTKTESPFLLFRTASRKEFNISYFRTGLMRDVAYLKILDPTLHPNHVIHLGLKDFFGRYHKAGTPEHVIEFFDVITKLNISKFNQHYKHITKITEPNDVFTCWQNTAAFMLYCIEHLQMPVIHKDYTLDLLIRKTQRYANQR